MIFYIYITVVKPAQVTDNLNPSLYFKEVAFKPNTIKRHFIRVPPNSTWACKSFVKFLKHLNTTHTTVVSIKLNVCFSSHKGICLLF